MTDELDPRVSIMLNDPRYEKAMLQRWPELLAQLEEIKKKTPEKVLHKQTHKVSNKPRIDIAQLADKRRKCGELKKAGLPCTEFTHEPPHNTEVREPDNPGSH